MRLKSFPQKEREILRGPVVPFKGGEMVRCPKCKSKMTKENFEKYGKCYTCSMQEKVKR